MYLILEALTRMMAPVLSFTAEEIWGFLPGEREESVHLSAFPAFDMSLVNSELEAKYDLLIAVRGDVAKVLELARVEKTIGHSLDARVELAAHGDLGDLLSKEADQLASIFIVSQVAVKNRVEQGIRGENLADLEIRVTKAEGSKCSRCWNYATTVGEDSDHPQICTRCLDALS